MHLNVSESSNFSELMRIFSSDDYDEATKVKLLLLYGQTSAAATP